MIKAFEFLGLHDLWPYTLPQSALQDIKAVLWCMLN